ncbi:MAG: hypothetical protein ACYC91_03635 [Solirubrobacteraceae bacterium]
MGIARGPAPDNHLWVTDFATDSIDAISTAGRLTASYLVRGYQPQQIAEGRNHTLWFTIVAPTGAVASIVTPLCRVPRVVGRGLSVAVRLLRAGNCAIGSVRGPQASASGGAPRGRADTWSGSGTGRGRGDFAAYPLNGDQAGSRRGADRTRPRRWQSR